MNNCNKKICSQCYQVCKKTKFGSSVILCKENIRLCMDCYFFFKEFENLKKRYNLINFLRDRELNVFYFRDNLK